MKNKYTVQIMASLKKPFLIFKLIALIFICSNLQAIAGINQSAIPVTGRVTGVNNEALPNVSVAVKGTQTGTTTDASGNFSITVPNESSVLVFSYVGYGSQEVIVGNRTTINVSMTTTGAQLSEVVVIGYGTAARRDLTG